MSSIWLSDKEWTFVKQQFDAIRAAQAQTARAQGRELVTVAAMRQRAAPQVVAEGQPRRPTLTRDHGVAAGETTRQEEVVGTWAADGGPRRSLAEGTGVARSQWCRAKGDATGRGTGWAARLTKRGGGGCRRQ
ncbi:unnamed protein product [Linum trigynum]|uniref:Uncharacterized protein n=1 Tax=Linum trigynum TaxID=586398 RepID=A0AAV2EV82_9ROSI